MLKIYSYSLFWMGMLMLDQYMYEDAKKKFDEAKLFFIATNNQEYEIKLYKNIGVNYLLVNNKDSSLFYFDKALNLAMKYNRKDEQAQITQNIGVAFNEKGKYKEAIKHFQKAIEIDSTAHKSGRVFLNIAKSYLGYDKVDSARYYAKFSLQWMNRNSTSTPSVRSSVYALLSRIDEQTNNYKGAVDYQKLYIEDLAMILSKNKNEAIIEAEKKYKFENMQKDIIEISLKQLKTQRILILTLLLLVIFTIIYYRTLLCKNKQLIKANEEILSLTEELKDFDITKEYYKDNLVHNFNVIKRATSLEYYVRDTGNKQGKLLIKKFNEIVYGKETIDWDILYKIVNSVYDGLFDKLKKKYPDLDEVEFRICCLIYSKFNSNEIATIMQLSVNTIHMKTTYIRKKLYIKKYGNLIDFFNKSLII